MRLVSPTESTDLLKVTSSGRAEIENINRFSHIFNFSSAKRGCFSTLIMYRPLFKTASVRFLIGCVLIDLVSRIPSTLNGTKQITNS